MGIFAQENQNPKIEKKNNTKNRYRKKFKNKSRNQ